jgi:TRAP-type C4-dicarboxylate transport system substrate-binding protein
MEALIDGPIGVELLDKVTNIPSANLIGFCSMDSCARNIYDTQRPIRSIDDLKSLKMRVMGNDVRRHDEFAWRQRRGDEGQVFTALQTGVVDGAENDGRSFVFDDNYQVAHYCRGPSTWFCAKSLCSRSASSMK